MSRARLFKRAADWVKNCIRTKEQVRETRERRRAFRFAFGQLEERVVLDADFSFDGVNVLMDNYASSGAEALAVSETATHYEFTLNEGVWTGSDGSGVAGNGLSTLSVEKSSGVQTITSDGSGINVEFAAVDFGSAGTVTDIDFTAGDITQTGAIDASTVNAGFSGTTITLNNAANDFDVVNLASVAAAEIVEQDGMTVNDAVASDRVILETVAGDLTLTGNIVSPNGLMLLSGNSIIQTSGTVTDPSAF